MCLEKHKAQKTNKSRFSEKIHDTENVYVNNFVNISYHTYYYQRAITQFVNRFFGYLCKYYQRVSDQENSSRQENDILKPRRKNCDIKQL